MLCQDGEKKETLPPTGQLTMRTRRRNGSWERKNCIEMSSLIPFGKRTLPCFSMVQTKDAAPDSTVKTTALKIAREYMV